MCAARAIFFSSIIRVSCQTDIAILVGILYKWFTCLRRRERRADNRKRVLSIYRIMTMESIIKLHFLFLLLPLFLVIGCAAHKPLTLMETPVLYYDSVIDPFAHLSDDHRSVLVDVFYATNREPEEDDDELRYGNKLSSFLHFGTASVLLGKDLESWEDLYTVSLLKERNNPVEMMLSSMNSIGSLQPQQVLDGLEMATDNEIMLFASQINLELAKAKDKEIIIYLNGAKDSFPKTVTRSAEIDHFAGRDFVSIAYAWPVHQEIFSYFLGIDVFRAAASTKALRALLTMLADTTTAHRINVICYSAGGRLLSRALHELREAHAGMTKEEIRSRFRIGTVVFAAADVPVSDFLARLPGISDVAEQVVVTISDADNALQAARHYMGHGIRVGMREGEAVEEQFVQKHGINNFEVIDLSHGQEERGFDITGHHYWYRHPWASSDIIFLLRTDLAASRRGLSHSPQKNIWYLAPDYPKQVRDAAQNELQGQW